ncbi:hypothetical protein COOONC_10514 [Cooperia oncophora]
MQGRIQMKAKHEAKSDRFFLKKVRWQISILAHIGFAIAFGIRANFGVAKNRMMNNFTDAYGDTHLSEERNMSSTWNEKNRKSHQPKTFLTKANATPLPNTDPFA